MSAFLSWFPKLSDSKVFEITSPFDVNYNCIAWAAQDVSRNWWPDSMHLGYWPSGVPREETIEVFAAAYGTLITRGPTDDLPFGYSVFLDDGTGETQIFIAASTGVNPFNIPFVKPGRRIRVSGFSGQFLAQYEVLPRFRGDIHRAP